MRKHRFRQTPQRSSRFPIRSMKIIRLSSLFSTLVTRWPFKRSCFLINVSMSTSVLSFLWSVWKQPTKGYRTRGAFPLSTQGFKSLQLQLHFWGRNHIFGVRYEKIMMGEYHQELVRDEDCLA